MRMKLVLTAASIALIGACTVASAQTRAFDPDRGRADHRMAPPVADANDPYYGTPFDDIYPYTGHERPLYAYPAGSYFAPDNSGRGW